MGTHIGSFGHGKPETVLSAVNATADTVTSLTAYNVSGYTKILVTYTCTSGWDRAGDIKIYGMIDGTNYVLADNTVENSTFSVSSTDDAGEYYVVENICPKIKIGWSRTTAGATGTLTAVMMPFND